MYESILLSTFVFSIILFSFSINSVPITIFDNSPSNLNSPFLFKAPVVFTLHGFLNVILSYELQ